MNSWSQVESFGSLDAQEDALLESCFADHPAYQHALAHRRFLILGRKGSGKSAIYRKIKDTVSPDIFALGQTFEHYPWDYQAAQKAVGVPPEQAYLRAWTYLILIAFTKILVNRDQSLVEPEKIDSLDVLRAFLVDSYGTSDPEVTTVWAPATKIAIKGKFGIDLKLLKLGVDSESIDIVHLPRFYHEINENLLKHIIRLFRDDINYYVCFDELDKSFDKGNVEYEQRLTGLILAAKFVNREIKAAGKRASVLVFLRDDIFNDLEFEDKQKTESQSAAWIRWDAGGDSLTLRSLMEKRLASVLDAPETDIWEKVFSDGLMRGRREKYDYIVQKTYRRPRDMIQFCNSVLHVHRTERPNEEKFTNFDITVANKDYSRYFFKELSDEVFKHIPQYKNYFDLLRDVSTVRFDMAKFQAICVNRPALTGGVSALEILGKLFEFSIIGHQAVGGRGGGAAWKWKYLDADVTFNETATVFQVHPGFQDFLGLKGYTKLKKASGPALEFMKVIAPVTPSDDSGAF